MLIWWVLGRNWNVSLVEIICSQPGGTRPSAWAVHPLCGVERSDAVPRRGSRPSLRRPPPHRPQGPGLRRDGLLQTRPRNRRAARLQPHQVCHEANIFQFNETALRKFGFGNLSLISLAFYSFVTWLNLSYQLLSEVFGKPTNRAINWKSH